MDLLANVPSWDDIERNLDHKFSALNKSIDQGLQSANDGWDGMSRRVSNGVSQAYGYMGGDRIDHVRQAMALSYPIMQSDLTRKWASININEILPVLIKLVQEVVMILGGSVAVGGAIGGAAGVWAFGIGVAPGAAAGAGIGLQVGNLILLALGLSAIAEYFYKGLPACLSTLQEGLATAWHAEDGLKPAGLDPTGGSAAQVQERTERAARQLARGQEQLVMLLLTAIVTYLTRGQMKAGVTNSLESIATRSAKLQADISNKEFAAWLARNEQKILAQPELQPKDVTPLKKAEPEPPPEGRGERSATPKIEMFKKGWTAEDVLAIPKGSRPDPSVYLTPEYMEYHLAQFKNGASRVMPVRNFEKYGIGQTDGTSFIMPHHEVDEIFAKAAGDKRILEQKLGLPEGFLEKEKIVRIDIPTPKELGLRIPSGNEAGANEFWLPGGKLPDGNLEAIIDAGKISRDRLITTPIP
jgi:hypothetical protein